MSRVVLALALAMLFPGISGAQSPPKDDIVGSIAQKSAEIVKLEARKKCPEPGESDEIIVCADVDKGADQLIFEDQRKLESSGASANANAAACIPGTGCRQPLTGGQSFGKRRPPAIPIEEVYRGLPEPDMVVPEGSSGQAPATGPQ